MKGSNEKLKEILATYAQMMDVNTLKDKESLPLRERTFIMIKPDAFERGLVGEVFNAVQNQRNFNLIACKSVQLTPEDCEKHYSHHVGKGFFPDLVDFMTSGPSLALVFEGDNVCFLARQLIGDSKHPTQVQPGSIRGQFAIDFPRNLVHGSDSHQDALREASIYFSSDEFFTAEEIERFKQEDIRKQEEHSKMIQEKIAAGIKLGEDIFAADVLKPGDWIADDNALLEIISTNKNPDFIHLVHKDYAVNPSIFGKINQNYVTRESVGLAWYGDALKLVGRDGKFLEGYASPIFRKSTTHATRFKNGQWLPVFLQQKDKLQKKIIKKKLIAASHHEESPFVIRNLYGGNIYFDIFDPRNNFVIRIVRDNLPDSFTWRLFGGDGLESWASNSGSVAATKKLMDDSQLCPGQLSILFRDGEPYLASYGDKAKPPIILGG